MYLLALTQTFLGIDPRDPFDEDDIRPSLLDPLPVVSRGFRPPFWFFMVSRGFFSLDPSMEGFPRFSLEETESMEDIE